MAEEKNSERKLKRLPFTVDVLFDDFVDKSHLEVLANKILNALHYETDAGDGLGDDNAIPIEIRVFNPEAGVASYKWVNKKWEYNFIKAELNNDDSE